jgi:hypothetical protein
MTLKTLTPDPRRCRMFIGHRCAHSVSGHTTKQESSGRGTSAGIVAIAPPNDRSAHFIFN